MEIKLSKEFLKQQVKIMRDLIDAGVCEKCHTHTSISQGAAYNIISKMYGVKDWNTMSAILKKLEE